MKRAGISREGMARQGRAWSGSQRLLLQQLAYWAGPCALHASAIAALEARVPDSWCRARAVPLIWVNQGMNASSLHRAHRSMWSEALCSDQHALRSAAQRQSAELHGQIRV